MKMEDKRVDRNFARTPQSNRSIDIVLLRALLNIWNWREEGDPIIKPYSATALKPIPNLLGEEIQRHDNIFVVELPWYEEPEILDEETLRHFLDFIFVLSPKLYEETLHLVSNKMEPYLSDYQKMLLKEREKDFKNFASNNYY